MSMTSLIVCRQRDRQYQDGKRYVKSLKRKTKYNNLFNPGSGWTDVQKSEERCAHSSDPAISLFLSAWHGHQGQRGPASQWRPQRR